MRLVVSKKKLGTSITKAKTAIADHKKAVGRPEGLADLMVFFCERAAGFSSDARPRDEGYFNALVPMFEQSLKVIGTLPEDRKPGMMARLDAVRQVSQNFAYGAGDDINDLLVGYGFDAKRR